MPKHSVRSLAPRLTPLLALSIFTAIPGTSHAQTVTENVAKDEIQQSYDWRLKGLPSVEVIRYKFEPDYVLQSSGGTVTSDELISQIAAVLRRYRVPMVPLAPSAVSSFKPTERVGSLVMIPASRTTSYTRPAVGQIPAASSLTLRLELQEAATLRRDPSKQVNTIMWDDELTIDDPQVDGRKRLFDAVSRLAQNFALAYLAANQPR